MTTTKLNLTRLVVGDTLRDGDLISLGRNTNYKNPKSDANTQKDVLWSEPRPIQPHTIGCVILGSKFLNARYFRP